jgi:hypothetical protein
MLEIELIEVTPLWAIGLCMDIDITKNEDQGGSGEKGSWDKTSMSERNAADDNSEGVV